MNFPISSLPSVAIASNLFSYAIMMVIYIIALLASGIYPSLHWLQYIYYFVCLMAFLFSFSLFNSTISVLIRDYQFLLQAVTRLLFFLLPVFGILTQSWGSSPGIGSCLEAESAFYIIDGFRNSLLDGQWFFQDVKYTLYFWLFTLFLLTVGSVLHMKFRDKFIDFL